MLNNSLKLHSSNTLEGRTIRKTRNKKHIHRKIGCLLFMLICVIFLSAVTYIGFKKIDLLSFMFKFNNGSVTMKKVSTSFNINGSIYFIKGSNLWKISGSNLIQLTKSGKLDQMDISSDTKFIVYTTINTNYSNLFLWNLSDNSTTELTHTGLTSNLGTDNWYVDPVISPNDDLISFLSDMDGYITQTPDLSVYSMDFSGYSISRISHSNPFTGGDQDETFYPLNERYIIYVKYIYLDGAQQPVSQLYLMDLSTMTPYTLSDDKTGILQPSFSADGKYIIFSGRDTNDIAANKNDSIYIMPFNLSNINLSNPDSAFLSDYQQRVLIKSGLNAMPVFSPNGQNIAYITENGTNFDLATMKINISTGKNGNLVITHSSSMILTSGFDVSTISRISWLF